MTSNRSRIVIDLLTNQVESRKLYLSNKSEVCILAETLKVKKKSALGVILRRCLFVFAALIIMLASVLVLVLNTIFNGPSPAARGVLTMALIEASATKWVPGVFLDDETIAAIRAEGDTGFSQEVSDVSSVIIRTDSLTGQDEWEPYPDGIRIEQVKGPTYTAHVMIVRDPSRVYLGVSNPDGFTFNVPGKRINAAIEDEGATAAVNAGAFWDNGKISDKVGAVPQGLVFSGGECVWTDGAPPNGITGFAGFNEDNVLIVHQENITQSQAEELNIRDGCCFGPVLIMNGEINLDAYNRTTGLNPRTAIGQRSDGAVIFVCIDGRQASSAGGEYADIINIMQEYGAVNACNMDGGSSSVMMYRDAWGRYGQAGETVMINSYSLLQAEPRRMPDFWMVR